MKQRKCRNCKKLYTTPSPWPGCCSESCKKKRASTLQKIRKSKPLTIQSDLKRWYKLRYEAFRKYGNKCQVCGSANQLQVDHIKPRSKFPELAWDLNNLQILCAPCNQGKGARFQDDWRD